MQQVLTSLFGENKVAQYGAMAVVALIALLLLWWLLRTVFSGRVRPAGGRNRQPRLGIVDAYDIDRQRQLVLIRRDGIEHLIMIGGPNDVVIEAGILRVQSPSRERAERETTGFTLGQANEMKLAPAADDGHVHAHALPKPDKPSRIPIAPPPANLQPAAANPVAAPITPAPIPPAPVTPAPVPPAPVPPAPIPPVSAAAPLPESGKDTLKDAIIAAIPQSVPAELPQRAPIIAQPEPAQRVQGPDGAAPTLAEPVAVPAQPAPVPAEPAPSKSIFAKMASRFGAGAAQDSKAEAKPPLSQQPAVMPPSVAAPQIPVTPVMPKRPDAAAPNFPPRPPSESNVQRPEIFPPAAPEAPVVHSPEDLELLKQLQAWTPKEPVVSPTLAEGKMPALPELPANPAPAPSVNAAPALAANPAPTNTATTNPVSPTVRPSLSSAVPRPTFTPRTFTPMKPIAPKQLTNPAMPERPAPVARTHDPTAAPLAGASHPVSSHHAPSHSASSQSAAPAPTTPVLDDLEEEMARLLGRPVKPE